MHTLYPANPNVCGSWDLLPLVRDLYSHQPETQGLESWDLQTLLWSLNYTGELLPEDAVAVAVEVARTNFDPDEGVR